MRSGRVQKNSGTPSQSSGSSDKVIQPRTADGSEAAIMRKGKGQKLQKPTLLRRLMLVDKKHPQDCAVLKVSHVLQAGLAA